MTPQAEAAVPSSPPVQRAEASYQYDIAPEIEQKSTIDLSFKKVQKQNKELEKKNIHLLKSVETLRKERELLVSERLKLKSENKTLERELKKVSSKERLPRKSSQPTFEEAALVDMDVLRDKIQALEDQLMEKDRIATLLKLRLDNLDVTESNELEELDKSSNSVHTKNGGIVDPAMALEMLVEEHDNSMRLRRENDGLKSKLTAVEAELEACRAQREWTNPSPKSPRKKSSGFFKRGKKSTSSLKHTHEEARQDLTRSQSPDAIAKSDSHEQLDTSVSPIVSHNNKESSVSLPCYGSPNHSPRLPTKNRMDTEILTLQSCLKLAIEEKSIYNEDKLQLEKELDGAKSKIAELEEALATAAENAKAEIEKLRGDLKSAEIERDTYCEELKITQSEVDELAEKNDSFEQMYTKVLIEKNKRIEELEQEQEALKKTKVTSPSHHKPPAHGSSSLPKKTTPSPARERLISPPKTSIESSTETQQSSHSATPRERLSSTESSPKQDKRMTRDRSQEKVGAVTKTVPSSPTRKVGRLSRESSIDRFEMPPKEDKRKISNSGVSSPSLSHSPKVAATRAMFEQKIDETKSDLSNVRRSSKSSLFERRRNSLSTDTTAQKAQQQPQHSKSHSYDYSAKQATPTQRGQEASTGSTAKSKVVPPTAVMEQVNEVEASTNEAKRSPQHQVQEKKNTAAEALKKSSRNSENVKVSRITITSVASPTSSPVLAQRKEFSGTGSSSSSSTGDQPTSPSAVYSRAQTSPSLNSSGTSQGKPSQPATTPTTSSRGQANTAPARVSTVSTTVRHVHSVPAKMATMSEIPSPSPSKIHTPPVMKSQTESKIHTPSSSSTTTRGIGGARTSHTSQVVTTTTTSTSVPNRVVVKRLGDNLTSSAVNKSGSLQNLPSRIEQESSSKNTAPQSAPKSESTTTPTKVSTVTATSTSASSGTGGSRRGPTHKALQRRERKDRPKTMYAGRAETTNLVNLISKFQEEEKEKTRAKEAPASSRTTSGPTPKVNGTLSPGSAIATPSFRGPGSSSYSSGSGSSSSNSNVIPTSVTMRQSTGSRQPRPASMHSTTIQRYK